MNHYGWQLAFLVPSVLGLALALVWWRYYRSPEEHESLTSAEARYIREGEAFVAEPGPGSAQLLGIRQTWGLMLCRLLVGPVLQFYIYWLPEYLYRVRGFSLMEIAFFTWAPFLFGDIGSIGGGWAAGYMIRRGYSVKAARITTLGFGAALCLVSLAVVFIHPMLGALLAICVVLFGHSALSANMFAAISDMFPSSAVARVTGLTGIAGGMSGMIFPLLTGYLVDKISYTPVFVMASLMPAAGIMMLWWTSRGFRRVSL
jgi:ACS family hexuronate transporter-like MFS transporter